MIPKIKFIEPLNDYILRVSFVDGKVVLYDVKEDIKILPGYDDLQKINGLWQQVQIDESRTCVFWNDYIDLASDSIYEFGIPIVTSK
jgi:hypothetical protein